MFLYSTELRSQSDSTVAELKEEKSEVKRLKGELLRTQEELSDTKSEKEGAEKVRWLEIVTDLMVHVLSLLTPADTNRLEEEDHC